MSIFILRSFAFSAAIPVDKAKSVCLWLLPWKALVLSQSYISSLKHKIQLREQ